MNADLRATIGREEFDYPALMSALVDYARPRGRVTALLRRGEIVRVKKGLYVFGERYRTRPYSKEVLANLIYGPSCVSLDTALSYHGLIPEAVQAVTSVTPQRARTFETPVGTFVYRQVPRHYYPIGVDRMEQGEVAFLMAVPERALADKVRDDRGRAIRTVDDAATYLFEDLRLDVEAVRAFDVELIEKLAVQAHSQKLVVCVRLLRQLKLRRLKETS